MKTLTLSYPHVTRTSVDAYRVEQVVDSTDYHPGQLLEKVAVKDLCELNLYKVVMNRSKESTQ